MVKALVVLLSTFLLLCGGAAHEHSEGGTTCSTGTMEAATEAALKLADDGERKVILAALEKIKTGETQLECVRRERCRLPAHPPAAAAVAPPLPAPRRHPLALPGTPTPTLTPARPPCPHAAARRAACTGTRSAMLALRLSPRRWPRASSLC
jgi:hypothetical protein